MAITRKLLKGMGLTEEQQDTIIEAHTDTVNGLKADIDRYRTDAEKLPAVQKELDGYKQSGGADQYKSKYEAEHKAFEAYFHRTGQHCGKRQRYGRRRAALVNQDADDREECR